MYAFHYKSVSAFVYTLVYVVSLVGEQRIEKPTETSEPSEQQQQQQQPTTEKNSENFCDEHQAHFGKKANNMMHTTLCACGLECVCVVILHVFMFSNVLDQTSVGD